MVFSASARGIDASGATHVTEQLQQLIDDAAEARSVAVIEPGTYLTAPLFLPSHVTLRLEEGATLLGTNDESRIPVVDTRVAGFEIPWYPGVLNINDAEDVTVTGGGTIDGNGEYFWRKYWGEDTHGGMRADYEPQGLRWAVDYDCRRVRNLVVMRSSGVTIDGLVSLRSGFWNLHVCHSHDVTVRNVTVKACGWNSPSTDGIDIDSSHDVLVERCDVSCNDDNICIKAGRDADGLRVNEPCHHVTVRDCTLRAGAGLTMGSEVSGGIHDIVMDHIRFEGTANGFHIKSAGPRKGYVRGLVARNLTMRDVAHPIHINSGWNPAYSAVQIPENWSSPIPEHWQVIAAPVPENLPNTRIHGILVENLVARVTEGHPHESSAIVMRGFDDSPIDDVTLRDIDIEADTFGGISNARRVNFERARIACRQ